MLHLPVKKSNKWHIQTQNHAKDTKGAPETAPQPHRRATRTRRRRRKVITRTRPDARTTAPRRHDRGTAQGPTTHQTETAITAAQRTAKPHTRPDQPRPRRQRATPSPPAATPPSSLPFPLSSPTSWTQTASPRSGGPKASAPWAAQKSTAGEPAVFSVSHKKRKTAGCFFAFTSCTERGQAGRKRCRPEKVRRETARGTLCPGP